MSSTEHSVRKIVFEGPPAAPIKVREEFRVSATGQLVTDRVKVVFVTSGWSYLELDGSRFELLPGRVATVPGSAWSSSFPAGHLRTVTFYIQPEFLEAQSPWLPIGKPLTHQLRMALLATGHPGLLNVGEMAMHALAPRLYALAKLQELPDGDLGLLARAADVLHTVNVFAGSNNRAEVFSVPTAVPRADIAHAASLLHGELERRWSIEELARAVSLSSSQLSRLFRRELGMSPSAYLWRARVDRIAEILATGGISFGEAARASGWSHHSAASRAFRRRFGISPHEFMDRVHILGTTLPERSTIEPPGHRPN